MSVQENGQSDRERPADYRMLVDSLADTELIMLDSAGVVRSWNRGAQALYGFRADEAIGKPAHAFYLEQDKKAGLPEQELRLAAERGRLEVEAWRLGRRGERFWANVVLQPMRDAQGELSGFVRFTKDITAKRSSESELKTAALMLNSITDYEVILIDRDGYIRSWNRGAETLKGYRANEVIGKHVSIFCTEDDIRSGLATRELETALRDGRLEFEGWRVRKGGTRFWANVILTPALDEEGQHVGFVLVARDLTDRLERQRTMDRQRDEILELSTPVMQVWERVLALPIIGTLDSQRAARLTENLLQKIANEEAEFVIIDISGVPMIDTQVAQHLLKTVQGASLMGAECIVSGVRPETAQAMVHLGIEMGNLRSRATLRDALQLALRLRKDRSDQRRNLEV